MFHKKKIYKASDPLRDLMDSLEPKIQTAFMQAIDSLKDQETLKQIVSLLEAGNVNDAMDIIQKHIKAFATQVINFHTLAGQVAAKTLSGIVSAIVSFDQTNYRAVQTMQQNQLRLISEFTDDQKQVIRDIMTSGISRGINPIQQADVIKDYIGLTSRQAQAVNNYRRLLNNNSAEVLSRELRDARFDRSVINAMNGKSVLTQEQINRMVNRYAENQLKFRAETIARTEALRAVNQSNQEMLMQAVESGDLIPEETIQEWLTAGDSHVRDSHVSMHGQQRQLGQPFLSGDGVELAFPGDPSAPAKEVIKCRCTTTVRLTNNN